jgi:hypothetical protein
MLFGLHMQSPANLQPQLNRNERYIDTLLNSIKLKTLVNRGHV